MGFQVLADCNTFPTLVLSSVENRKQSYYIQERKIKERIQEHKYKVARKRICDLQQNN